MTKRKQVLLISTYVVIIVLAGMVLVLAALATTKPIIPLLPLLPPGSSDTPKTISPVIWIIGGLAIIVMIVLVVRGGMPKKVGEVRGWFTQMFKPAEGKKAWPVVAMFLGIPALIGAIVVALTIVPSEMRSQLWTPMVGLISLIIVAILTFATKDKENGVRTFFVSLATIALLVVLGFLVYGQWPSPTASGVGKATTGEWELCWDKHPNNVGVNPTIREDCLSVKHLNMEGQIQTIDAVTKEGAVASFVWNQEEPKGIWFNDLGRTKKGGAWGLRKTSATEWAGYVTTIGGENATMTLRQK